MFRAAQNASSFFVALRNFPMQVWQKSDIVLKVLGNIQKRRVKSVTFCFRILYSCRIETRATFFVTLKPFCNPRAVLFAPNKNH